MNDTSPTNGNTENEIPASIYKFFSQFLQDTAWTADLNPYRLTYMSPSVERLTGYSLSEAPDIAKGSTLTSESLKRWNAEWKRQMASDKSYNGRPHSWSVEVELRSKNGTTVWAEVNPSIVHDDAGRPSGIAGIARDITERKRAEQAVRESESKYRALFDNSIDGICVLDQNGVFLDVNRAMLRIFGYSKEELIGLNVSRLTTPVWSLACQPAIDKRGHARNFEIAFHRRDNTKVDCLASFYSTKDGCGRKISRYQGSIRDISGYRSLQKCLRVYINEVTKAQERERLRISRDLHDGVLQDLLAVTIRIDEAVKSGKSLEDAHRLLEDVRFDINRVAEEARLLSQDLRPSILDQLGLMAAIRTTIENVSRHSNINFSLKVVGAERRLCKDLELDLFRMAQECINNVKEHSNGRSCQVYLCFEEDIVNLMVVDDGTGFRVPKRLGDLPSNGKLGLAGIQERVNAFNGKLSIECKRGQGTVVSIHAPAPSDPS